MGDPAVNPFLTVWISAVEQTNGEHYIGDMQLFLLESVYVIPSSAKDYSCICDLQQCKRLQLFLSVLCNCCLQAVAKVWETDLSWLLIAMWWCLMMVVDVHDQPLWLKPFHAVICCSNPRETTTAIMTTAIVLLFCESIRGMSQTFVNQTIRVLKPNFSLAKYYLPVRIRIGIIHHWLSPNPRLTKYVSTIIKHCQSTDWPLGYCSTTIEHFITDKSVTDHQHHQQITDELNNNLP